MGEFLRCPRSGKRLEWVNFKAGEANGFGMTVGATVALGIAIWILAKLVHLPVVGEYFNEAKQYVTDYTESTNYQDEFTEQLRLLSEMEQTNKELLGQPEDDAEDKSAEDNTAEDEKVPESGKDPGSE